ncbi:oxidoreductase [Kitasatospora viridis]|uniref:Aryl-alcohol dehydrogenase-like predicted oxidoreductase n=1 Tax=Kitasatospora viridis TaxID=281105 RepID=A0A561UQD0_9ACTN|nr:aryl-alcohol dehydrogenase-like predicted oxidoreductase [Kitasatospora viridis]
MTTVTDAGTWQLGDLTVNRIGYGTMRLGGNGMAGNSDGAPIDRAHAIRLLRTAVESGVNHIDTASFYFSALRSANELINSALAPYADELVIVTKVGPGRTPAGEWTRATRPEELRGQVEENLRQLGRDHLDVVNYRRGREDSIAEHFGVLAELREAGLIRHLGISSVKPEHLAEAQAIAPVVCVQNYFSLDRRVAEQNGLLASCREQGIAFVPFFSISGTQREAAAVATDHETVREVARAHGVTTAQVRLAWTLAKGPNMLVIPGTTSIEHLGENLAAGQLRLTEAELAALDAIDG